MTDYILAILLTVGGVSAVFAIGGLVIEHYGDWLDKLADRLLGEENAHGQAR